MDSFSFLQLPWFPRALVFSWTLLSIHEAGLGSWKDGEDAFLSQCGGFL